jgi:rhodanese-related sulfurtransferase
MLNILKNVFGNTEKADLGSLIAKGAYLVDVRSPQEFAGNAIKGSVNIPLDRIQSKIAELKGKQPIVVFCRSGNRSGAAKSILEKNGISQVYNGGSWGNVKQYVK